MRIYQVLPRGAQPLARAALALLLGASLTGLTGFSGLSAADATTPIATEVPGGAPAPAPTPAPADGGAAKVDMKLADDLRKEAQLRIAALLKVGGSHMLDLVVAGQAQTVELVGVNDKNDLLYKQFGKKRVLAFKDLGYGPVAAILQTLTEDTSPDVAKNNLIAGLLYALEGNSLASSAALTKAFDQDPDLSDVAQTRLKALQPVIAALHPTPAGQNWPAGGGGSGGGTGSLGPTTPGLPGPPPPSLQKTGYEHLGLAGGGAFFNPAMSGADPQEMMVNSDMSDAFITHDGGKTWRMIPHAQLAGNTQCRPCFHPTDPNVIYAGAPWSGVAKSVDGGEHWTKIGDVGRAEGEIAIDADNPNFLLVGTPDGVSFSADGGTTWTAGKGVKGKVIGFHIDRTSGAAARTCFVGTSDGVFRSDDGGKSWVEKDGGIDGKPLIAFTGGSNQKLKLCVLYASVASKAVGEKFTGGVYRSTDKGEHWEWAMGTGINLETKAADAYAAGPIAQYPFVLCCDANPQAVWALNSSTGFYPPHHEAVFRSDDMGKNWHATYFADPRFPQYNVEPNWLTALLGQSWQGGAGLGAAIDPRNPEHIFKVDMGFAYTTANGGKTWQNCFALAPTGVTPAKDTGWVCNGLTDTSTWNYYIDPHNPQNHYLCYTDISFARSVDAGKTWLWCCFALPEGWGNTTYELAFDPATPGKIWGAFSGVHDIPNGNIINGGHSAVGAGGIGLSTDSCVTFKATTQGLPSAPALSVVLDPKSPAGSRTLYAAIWEQGVYKSTDDGKSWTKKSSGLGALGNMRVIRVQIAADGSLYALITAKKTGGNFMTDGVGLYHSKDSADSWTLVPGSNKYLWPKDFTLDPANPGTIYLGCADATEKQGGLYRTTDSGATWTLVVRKGSQHFGVFLSPKNKGWLYMTLSEGPPEAGLYLSRDNGATWTPYLELPFSNAQRVTFDPKDDSVIYVTTFGGSAFKLSSTPRSPSP